MPLEIGEPGVDGRAHACRDRRRSRRGAARPAAPCPACGGPRRGRTRARGRRRRSRARARATSTARATTGSIVWLAISANGTGRIWSAAPTASRVKPRLRVPRIPSVSHSPVRVSRMSALRDEHEHLIAWCRVRGAARGQQDVVRFLAVGDDRRLLGDPNASAVALDRADAAAQIAADADLGRRRRDEPLALARARRGSRRKNGDGRPWRTRQATSIWCIA